MQKPSNHMQTLAIAYYVEGSRVVKGPGCLNYKMLLIHRMKPAPRVCPIVVTLSSVNTDR